MKREGKLSTQALLGVLCALIAFAEYKDWLPGSGTYWPWALAAIVSATYFLKVLLRLAAGERWN